MDEVGHLQEEGSTGHNRSPRLEKINTFQIFKQIVKICNSFKLGIIHVSSFQINIIKTSILTRSNTAAISCGSGMDPGWQVSSKNLKRNIPFLTSSTGTSFLSLINTTLVSRTAPSSDRLFLLLGSAKKRK